MEKEGEGGQGNGGRRAKRGDREAGQLSPSHTNKPMFKAKAMMNLEFVFTSHGYRYHNLGDLK